MRVHSSVVEHRIADPVVTGSIPVVPSCSNGRPLMCIYTLIHCVYTTTSGSV